MGGCFSRFDKALRVLALAATVLALAVPVAAEETPVPKWVLSETIINRNSKPLDGVGAGCGKEEHRWTVAETSMSLYTRSWTAQGECWNRDHRFSFDKPPRELLPGKTVEMKVSGSVTGIFNCCFPAAEFSFSAEGIRLTGELTARVDTTRSTDARTAKFVVPNVHSGKISVTALLWNCEACNVTWVYRAEGLPLPTPTRARTATATRVPAAPTRATTATPARLATATPTRAAPAGAATPAGPAESAQERMERTIAENLADYLNMRRKLEEELKPLYGRADSIMMRLRDAEWMRLNGLEEDKKEAEAEIRRLKQEMAELLRDFESKAAPYSEVLKNIEGLFVDYQQRRELVETLNAYRSELNLVRINLVLRSGNTEQFDRLFNEYRGDPNIAVPVLVGNAFRQLMDGDTRSALASVRLALEKDGEDPTARQLLQEIELGYLARIRDRLAGEQTESARLFNEKLNGHGEQGIGRFIVDLFTTGVGESVRAIGGYYDFVESIASLNIDEAARQVAGIRLIEDLRARGVTFEEMNAMSASKLQEIVLREYGRSLSEQDAAKLRQRVWDGFRNVDVEAIRRGDKTQYGVDIGRDYFDTTILQQDEADFLAKQFSAWDTFLTFAPSAQLGKIANTGLAKGLGLTSKTTLQQALQKGLRLHELGRRIYQSKSGAAMIDALQDWNGFETMVEDAIKNRVGETVYAAGSAAVKTYVGQMTAPAKEKLAEELAKISQIYLGEEATGNISTSINLLNGLFEFVGLNGELLRSGAYGVDKSAGLSDVIKREISRDQVVLNNGGVATAAGRPQSFEAFEADVKRGGGAHLAGLQDARASVKNVGAGANMGRRGIAVQADRTLEQMEEATRALQAGDAAKARTIWSQMQSGAGRALDENWDEGMRRLGERRDRAKLIDGLAAKPPTDREFVQTMLGVFAGGDEYRAGRSELNAALTAAGLLKVPE